VLLSRRLSFFAFRCHVLGESAQECRRICFVGLHVRFPRGEREGGERNSRWGCFVAVVGRQATGRLDWATLAAAFMNRAAREAAV
jgi:hypothetical protein